MKLGDLLALIKSINADGNLKKAIESDEPFTGETPDEYAEISNNLERLRILIKNDEELIADVNGWILAFKRKLSPQESVSEHRYYAVKGINEDSFGYDFNNYTWEGAEEISPGKFRHINASGDIGIIAHNSARRHRILEDVTGAGDIAAPPGYSQGSEPIRAKKKRNTKIILGGKGDKK